MLTQRGRGSKEGVVASCPKVVPDIFVCGVYVLVSAGEEYSEVGGGKRGWEEGGNKKKKELAGGK